MKENINFEAENWNTSREHTLCSLSIKIDILPSFKYIFSYVESSESAKRCKTLTWYEFPLYLLLIFLHCQEKCILFPLFPSIFHCFRYTELMYKWKSTKWFSRLHELTHSNARSHFHSPIRIWIGTSGLSEYVRTVSHTFPFVIWKEEKFMIFSDGKPCSFDVWDDWWGEVAVGSGGGVM